MHRSAEGSPAASSGSSSRPQAASFSETPTVQYRMYVCALVCTYAHKYSTGNNNKYGSRGMNEERRERSDRKENTHKYSSKQDQLSAVS
jgi:hypothetical protein